MNTGVRTLIAMLALALGVAAQAQPPRAGLTPERMKELTQEHPGYYGALAPQNLSKPRPRPPFNLTGTWFVDLRRSFSDFMFGPPYPQFYAAGQQALKEAAAARKAGRPYRDVSGQCYPIGMPMIMTRVHPIAMIQEPTAIYMISGFFNALRVIYLDGRPHSDPDLAIPTANGESIGHWEGDTLVVSTKYFDPRQHYIDSGIPISDQFEITERIRMLDQGKTLEIAYTLVDPKNWKGEWHSTKHWLREDHSDIPEDECTPTLNENLLSTKEK